MIPNTEQSVVQETLDACTTETVQQLEAAWTTIYRQHSQGYRHDYVCDWQILDVDMSGLPCGKKAALATAGDFAKQRNRRGRQLGQVHEIVIDRLFDGKTQLNTALLPLVTATETTLELDAAKRERTLIRIDAGAGSISDINWLLMRGYFVLTEDYSTARAHLLAAQVRDWLVDPRDGERQVGLVPVPVTDFHAGQYRRTITHVAVRCRLANGQWGRSRGLEPAPRRCLRARRPGAGGRERPAARSTGGKQVKGRKRHLLVDTEGFVLSAVVHPADIMDRDGVKLLLPAEAIHTQFPRLQHVWLDAGYNGQDKGKDWIERTLGWSAEIVAHPPRYEKVWAPTDIPPEQIDWSKYGWRPPGFQVLPRRWLGERTFSWQSQNRRLSTDDERVCATSKALIYLAMIRLMLRRLTRV